MLLALAMGLAGLLAVVIEVQRGALGPETAVPLAALSLLGVLSFAAVAPWARGPVGALLGLLLAGPLSQVIESGPAVPAQVTRLYTALGPEHFTVALVAGCGVLALVLGLVADGVLIPPEPPRPRPADRVASYRRPRRVWGR